MAEVVERVARLEERFDGLTTAIAGLKTTVGDLDARMQTGFAELRAEMRSEFSAVRAEFRSEFVAVRGEFSSVRGDSAEIRAEMNTQFRWIMGGIGSAALAILVAILAKG